MGSRTGKAGYFVIYSHDIMFHFHALCCDAQSVTQIEVSSRGYEAPESNTDMLEVKQIETPFSRKLCFSKLHYNLAGWKKVEHSRLMLDSARH